MIRFLFKLILCALLALGASFGYLVLRSGDPVYTVYEWISPARFQQYDRLIRTVAAEHHLDPMLVKAVVWRESRFDPQKYGSARERGLMQVSEKAANEWARENKIDNFPRGRSFRSKNKSRGGRLVFAPRLRALGQSAGCNAFRPGRIQRGREPRATLGRGGTGGATISAKDFLRNIDFPGTRKYVDSIIERYEFYKRRGWGCYQPLRLEVGKRLPPA